jgi:hypothetical protein
MDERVGMEIDTDLFGRALLKASSADPGKLLDVLRAELRHLPGALDLDMHLIDYRLATLRPVEAADRSRLLRPAPVDASVLGEAFRTQDVTYEKVPAGQSWYVPISVRGQRLGVLTGTFAFTPSASARTTLRSLALAAAHAVLEMSPGTDLYEVSRRDGSLSVAAEMQWQLLPARAFETSDFHIAGHLEPALRVSADAYDFVVNDEVLTTVVVDASGSSTWPSGLTTLVITALRNARRSGLPLDDQASLANAIVWQHSAGRQQASAMLLQIDANSQRASVVDAGSPALLRLRDGQLAAQIFHPQTPLGMFADTDYAAQAVDLRPGDRVYLLSDGAFAGGRPLPDVIALLRGEEHSRQSPSESVRRLVTTLTDSGEELEDDITTVCLDWAP